jgi:hypothetical protein
MHLPIAPALALLACASLLLAACSPANVEERLRAEARQLEARDLNHLDGMPPTQAVLARIGDPSPFTALGRQCQALTKLHELLDDPLFVPPALRPLPPAAQALRSDYERTIQQTLFTQFTQVRKQGAGGNARQLWNQACKAEGPWTHLQVKQSEWLALLAPPARELAERHAAWYEKSVPALREARQQARQQRERSERMTVTAIGAAILALGVLILVKAIGTVRQLRRYEFEHCTDGGVVQFESYDAAERHRKREYLASRILYPTGVLLTLAGLVTTFARMFG